LLKGIVAANQAAHAYEMDISDWLDVIAKD